MNNDHQLERAAAPFDIDKYRPYIAHLGLPYERETEMLTVLRGFLAGFVDRAFGHDPIRLAAGDRLQLSDEGPSPAVVDLEPISDTNHFDLPATFADAGSPRQRKR